MCLLIYKKKKRLCLQTVRRIELIEMSTGQKRNFISVAKYINKLHLSENKEMLWVGLCSGFFTKGLSPVL